MNNPLRNLRTLHHHPTRPAAKLLCLFQPSCVRFVFLLILPLYRASGVSNPAGGYLPRLLRYQVPFYVHLLCDSDKLFPAIRKTSEDKAPLPQPWRGRLALAWDDGGGFDLDTGHIRGPGSATENLEPT